MVYDDWYSCPWPETHRFPMDKFHRLRDVLVQEGLVRTSELLLPPPAQYHWIARVHDSEYLDRFMNNQLSVAEQRKIGLHFDSNTPPYIVTRTLAELSGTVYAVELALQYGLACNLAGGTHHAHRDFGSGYTILNDMAVAAARAVEDLGCKKVVILDCDVHQGDGTATIFQGSETVITVSLHCEDNWPWNKQRSHIDVGLPKHTGDAEYLIALHKTMDMVLDSDTDLVIYDAGVDVFEGDVLGKLSLTESGIFSRDLAVLRECIRREIPVACVIGGGYDIDTKALGYRHSLVHRAAIQVWAET